MEVFQYYGVSLTKVMNLLENRKELSAVGKYKDSFMEFASHGANTNVKDIIPLNSLRVIFIFMKHLANIWLFTKWLARNFEALCMTTESDLEPTKYYFFFYKL